MPKTYLTLAERNKAKYIRERDAQVRVIKGELATTKYTIPMREIETKVGFSRIVISKVRNDPINATLKQLYDYCYATGKKVVITIE